MTAPYRVEKLATHHDRKSSSCGSQALDRYFRELVSQDAKRRLSNCFVAVDLSGVVAGYYTLASAGIVTADLPDKLLAKLPRYGSVPAALIGRLAISVAHHGKGLGAALIADAIDRTVASDAAVFAVLVDAKDASAKAFYQKLAFEELKSNPMSLFLPIATALAARAPGGGRT